MLLHEHLENKLDKQPDFLFSEFQGRQITYREANTLSNKLAHSLISVGLKKGDRFAFLSKNSSEMAFMYFGSVDGNLVCFTKKDILKTDNFYSLRAKIKGQDTERETGLKMTRLNYVKLKEIK